MLPLLESPPQVMIGRQEDIPSHLLDDFTATPVRLHVPFEAEENEQRVYCGIEHYLPTALVIFLAKPFFDGFLKKAGEDSYAAFKESLVALTTKATHLKMRIFSVGEHKVAKTSPFSRVISIYAHSASGTPIKFLLLDDASEDEANQIVDSILTLLHEHHSGETDNRLSELLSAATARRLQVLYYEADSGSWRPIEQYVALAAPDGGQPSEHSEPSGPAAG